MCRCLCWIASALLLAGLTAGCSPPKDTATERDVRLTFADFQEAMRARDGERLWELLDSESRQTAEREAQAAKITPQQFLASDAFCGQKQLQQLPGGVIDRLALQGDRATITFADPTGRDGNREQLLLLREGIHWRIRAPMPR